MTSKIVGYRRRFISGPVLEMIRKFLPRMSDTEREALEDSTIWWDAEIFSGRPNWKKLLALGTAKLTEKEQAFLDGPVEELCAMVDDWEINFVHRKMPDEVWEFIKSKGFLGMIIPEEYGGLGFSATAHSDVVVKLASRGAAAAVSVIVPNSLGPGELIMLYGTQAQKDHYLPRLADGREVPCFALTSLDAGSDAAAMADRGVVCYQTWKGKRTLGIRLTWSKRYITLGPIATLIGLAFKLHDPDHLLGDREDIGITAALVPADLPGVKIGRRHLPAMQAFQNGPNSGDDVFIPIEQVIGGRERVGQGWKMLVSALAAGRGISLPSLSVAALKVCSHSTGAYARVREQFNVPIGRFSGVQEAMARIAGQTYTVDAARRLTTLALDRGEKPSVISAILKYHATERLRSVISDAMDVHGGRAVCDGPRNYLGNTYRAVPVAITVEGANILTRSLIIFGQGAIRCHPYILREMMAATNPDQNAGLEDFDDAFFKHMRFQLKTFARAFFHSWTGGFFAPSPVRGPTAKYFRQANRMCATFALLSEAALISMGGALKRREMLSGRLGDILSELYLLSAVLKRFEDDGRPQADLALVRWSCRTSLTVAQQKLHEILLNLPSRPLSWMLRVILLPFGRNMPVPSDRLSQECANLLMSPSPARNRLTSGIYIGGADTPLGQLDEAYRKVDALKAVRLKMKKAKTYDIEMALAAGVISNDEAEKLHETQALVREVLEVDDFAPEELTGPAQRARANKSARPATRKDKGDGPSRRTRTPRKKPGKAARSTS